jgi:hypothetical protein
VTGDEVDNDGYGATCEDDDDDGKTTMATVWGKGLVG